MRIAHSGSLFDLLWLSAALPLTLSEGKSILKGERFLTWALLGLAGVNSFFEEFPGSKFDLISSLSPALSDSSRLSAALHLVALAQSCFRPLSSFLWLSSVFKALAPTVSWLFIDKCTKDNKLSKYNIYSRSVGQSVSRSVGQVDSYQSEAYFDDLETF